MKINCWGTLLEPEKDTAVFNSYSKNECPVGL